MESKRKYRIVNREPAKDHLVLLPANEARHFYRMYQKGHSLKTLRADIDVPEDVLSDWRLWECEEPTFHDALTTMLPFRKNVLRIFNLMVRQGMDA